MHYHSLFIICVCVDGCYNLKTNFFLSIHNYLYYGIHSIKKLCCDLFDLFVFKMVNSCHINVAMLHIITVAINQFMRLMTNCCEDDF